MSRRSTCFSGFLLPAGTVRKNPYFCAVENIYDGGGQYRGAMLNPMIFRRKTLMARLLD